MTDGCEECEDLHDRVAELEETVEQLIEYRGDNHLKDLWIDDHPIGRLLDQANQRSKEAKKAAENDSMGPRVDPDTRAAMLPAHRMWADIKLDAKELTKRQRRVATILGGIVQRASNKDTSDHDALEFQYVGKSNAKYTLSSGDAKKLLEGADTTEKDTFYSAEVARVFRDVQRLTKREECDCDHIESCGHGLVLFDATGGTNRLGVNQGRLHKYLESVTETAVANSDDDVTPTSGASEDPADTETADPDGTADQQLQRLEDASPPNSVVSNGEAEGVRSDGGATHDS